MAYQTLAGPGVPWPMLPLGVSAVPTTTGTTYVIDAAGEKVALIFPVAKAGNIHAIHFWTNTVFTGDTVDCRIETVDLTTSPCQPSGTLWATNTNGACVVATTDDQVWKSATLTADATVAVGDKIAVVIANGSGGGNMQIAAYSDTSSANGLPFGMLFTASWSSGSFLPIMAVEFSDGSFLPIYGVTDIGAPITGTAFNSGSTPDERGNVFQVPVPCKARGCWIWADTDGDYTVKVYDTDGTTVIGTTGTLDKDFRGSNGAGTLFLPFTTVPTFSALNSNYRVTVLPDTGTNLTVYDITVPDADMWGMYPGGTAMHMTTRTDAGAWTQTTTQRVLMGLMLTDFDDATGGGTTIAGTTLQRGMVA